MDTLQHKNPCTQKAPINARTQCNSGAYVMSEAFNIDLKLQSQLSLIIFFINLIVLCSGFKTPIYKPPKISLQN